MKLLALAVIAAIATAGAVYHMAGQKNAIPTPVYDSWVHWKQKHGRSYGTSTEEKMRMGYYAANFDVVMDHNNAGKSWTLTLGKFADMTQDEVAKQYTGYKVTMGAKVVEEHVFQDWPEKNWNDDGAVTPVKNQGQCGSCWAFSTTGSVEGANFLKTKTLQSFSEQQLVDCDVEQDQGCNGGLMDNAFKYIEANHPLMTEDSYAYRGRQGTCRYDAASGVGTVSSHADCDSSSSAMKTMIDNGPVSVAIEADQMIFQGYHSGVITGSTCGTQLDHGVLAVGYGTENGENYFLVKNSWGPDWGANGFVKIGANNVCGILQSASQPTA